MKELPINQIIQGDCLEVMKQMPDKCVDLVVTSPPYDDQRKYMGNLSWDFEGIAQELTRLLKDTGVIAWNVSDVSKDFCESLTSFKQAIFFVEKCGLKLADTMIYQKLSYPPTYKSMKRHPQVFEYIFVLIKDKSYTFNPIKDKPNKYAGKIHCGTQRKQDGSLKKLRTAVTNEFGMRTNVWSYLTGRGHSYKEDFVREHPAVMPIKLAEDLMKTFSNENDLILDPFGGSCTTAIAAQRLKRNYICIEKEAKYVAICHERLAGTTSPMF